MLSRNVFCELWLLFLTGHHQCSSDPILMIGCLFGTNICKLVMSERVLPILMSEIKKWSERAKELADRVWTESLQLEFWERSTENPDQFALYWIKSVVPNRPLWSHLPENFVYLIHLLCCHRNAGPKRVSLLTVDRSVHSWVTTELGSPVRYSRSSFAVEASFPF
jgi:hypothetical protein